MVTVWKCTTCGGSGCELRTDENPLMARKPTMCPNNIVTPNWRNLMIVYTKKS